MSTCKELYELDHPDDYAVKTDRKLPPYCPSHYGYLEDPTWCNTDGSACYRCWLRDISEGDASEEKARQDKINKICEDFKEGKISANDAREAMGLPPLKEPRILDSGNRREFKSGAVRDIQEGKGRCDLLPLDIVAQYLYSDVLRSIALFQYEGKVEYLFIALQDFNPFSNDYTMLLEVAKHFEEGCKKYGENNWRKGIDVYCYIDSAVRHYLKFLRGDKDEPHDRAFCWNIMCAIWTCKHKPELNGYAVNKESPGVNYDLSCAFTHGD